MGDEASHWGDGEEGKILSFLESHRDEGHFLSRKATERCTARHAGLVVRAGWLRLPGHGVAHGKQPLESIMSEAAGENSAKVSECSCVSATEVLLHLPWEAEVPSLPSCTPWQRQVPVSSWSRCSSNLLNPS